jgi:hypothetical protein
MANKFFNPLLDKYLGPKELESFKAKKEIKDLFNEVTSSELKQRNKVESSDKYKELTSNLKLEKVLVGSHGEKPFFALVDTKERVCLPLIYS